jgi:hypothetical protein
MEPILIRKQKGGHTTLLEKLTKLVLEHACPLEPVISEEDAFPYARKPYCVRWKRILC